MAVLTAGCATVDHPRAWDSVPAATKPDGCPDLSGTYVTAAIEIYPASLEKHVPLPDMLGSILLRDAKDQVQPWPQLPGATTAVLTSEKDWLHLRLRDKAGGEVALNFKRKDWWGGFIDGADAMYACMDLEQGPALAFEGSRRPLWAVPFGVDQAFWFAGSEFDYVILSRARDGSLVVNYRTSRWFVSAILIGSYARWVGNIWWRYPPVASDR